jgi:hypothetical protein
MSCASSSNTLAATAVPWAALHGCLLSQVSLQAIRFPQLAELLLRAVTQPAEAAECETDGVTQLRALLHEIGRRSRTVGAEAAARAVLAAARVAVSRQVQGFAVGTLQLADTVPDVITLAVVHEISKRLLDIARKTEGSRGFFSKVAPAFARCLSVNATEQGTCDDEQMAVQTANYLVGVSRLGSWAGLMQTFEELPDWLQRHPVVASRCLASAAFALRHRLGLPSDDALTAFIDVGTSGSTVEADSSSGTTHRVSLSFSATDARDAERVKQIAVVLLDSSLAVHGGLSAREDAVRHGVAALIGLNALKEASHLATLLHDRVQSKDASGRRLTKPHWTDVEIHVRRNEIAAALDAAVALGNSRTHGWGDAVPSLIVESLTRLAARAAVPTTCNHSSTSTGAHKPLSATRVLYHLIVGAHSFRSSLVRPKDLVEAATDAYAGYIALVADNRRRNATASSPVRIDIEESTLAFASALAAVAPQVSLRAASTFCLAAIAHLSSPSSSRDVAALAVWRVLEAFAGSAVEAPLKLVLTHAAERDSGVRSLLLSTGFQPTMGDVTLLWHCPHCNAAHSSATDDCRSCGAVRWPTVKCTTCAGSLSTTETLCWPRTPVSASCGCNLCGAKPQGPAATRATVAGTADPPAATGHASKRRCPQCRRESRGGGLSRWCEYCGAVHVAVAAPDVWQCGVCHAYRPWDETTCGACDAHFTRLPACATQPWTAVLASVTACAQCTAPVAGLLVTDCPACGYCLKPGARAAVTRRRSSEPTRQDDVLLWSCGHCGAACSSAMHACRECASLRPTSAKLLAHTPWVCVGCSAVQSATNVTPICERCHTLRPPETITDRPSVTLHGAHEVVPSAKAAMATYKTGSLELVAILRAVRHVLVPPGGEPVPLDNSAMKHAVVALTAHASALSKSLGSVDLRELACVAHSLGGLVGVAVLPAGRCEHCAGTHPEAMCPKRADPTWKCGECGVTNSNVGAQRYVCGGCLGVRPLMFDLAWCDAWECLDCGRVSCECDDSCCHCGVVRAEVAQRGGESTTDDGESGASTAPVDTSLPFFPAKCGACGAAHLEALCVECNRDDTVREEIRRGQAIVLGLNADGTAELQPCGTVIETARVTVPADVVESSLGSTMRVVGSAVYFDAAARGDGAERRLFATAVSKR